MCGICGWFNNKNKVDLSVVERMNDIAKHRGPDDEGYSYVVKDRLYNAIGKDSNLTYGDYISDVSEKNGIKLALAHRRLSVIDLSSNGHQPMQSEDGELCITFNGEIYNYLEIRNDLELRGYKFKTSSDTEVLLKAYQEYGQDCVNYFDGMWGFVIWDKKKDELFCSRDRLGAKPFFYYFDGDNFIFASEIKQLLENKVVPRVANQRQILSYVVLGISDYSHETWINKIYSLKGGYNLTINLKNYSENNVEIKKYWNINTNQEKELFFIEQAFKEHENAVKIRIRSDAPICAMLSGGLDSSILVSEIAELYKKEGKNASDLNTYTTCYHNYKEGDEREYAEAVNEYCGTTQNLIYVDTDNTFDMYKRMVWHMEGGVPIAMMGGVLTLEEVAKRGEKVVVNGQGSDETMFGYERYYIYYLKDILKHKGITAFIREYRNIVSNSKLNSIKLLEYYFYYGNSKMRRTRCLLRVGKYLSKKSRGDFIGDTSLNQYLEFSDMSEMQYNELRGTQLTHILRSDDRLYMAYSLESRVPFIDYKYVENSIRIPEREKINRGYTKYLLRKFIEGKLPDAVVWRKNKMGWPSPRERWISRFKKEDVEELFVKSRSENMFDIDKLKKEFKKNPYSYAVEKYINVELFLRCFNISL